MFEERFEEVNAALPHLDRAASGGRHEARRHPCNELDVVARKSAETSRAEANVAEDCSIDLFLFLATAAGSSYAE